MTYEQFTQLAAEGYNRIPLTREILADLDTPLSAYLKLASSPYTYLLESVQGGEKRGHYSMIGLPARIVIRVIGNEIVISKDGEVIQTTHSTNPLTWIADWGQSFRVPNLPNLPRFTGGLVGYFSYDTVRYIETRLADSKLEDSLKTPDILLMVSDEVVVFDNLQAKIYIIVHAEPSLDDAYARAKQRLETLVKQLLNYNLPISNFQLNDITTNKITEGDFNSGFARASYEQAVERAKEYIMAGDIMQVVLSQRLSIACKAPPLNVYRALRCLNPSPYMYYFNLGDFHIVGSSPEILVRLEEQQITVRPLAGTRPRGKTETEDLALERELLADPKERAEHLMLIDLGRNDVGRVAEIGSVQLTENMAIERYSHVMHIVSNVTGQLQDGFNTLDVLKATLPAGTLSGAPKIRAMEIIEELEPSKRGIYGGAVGYLNWYGDMDTAIAIRTAVIKDEKLYIQVGAGIVADSIPAKEWEETMNKGRAIFRAVAMSNK